MTTALHVGLIINPLAGLGGSLGLKGSDGEILRDRLREVPEAARGRARERARRALRAAGEALGAAKFSCWDGAMGAELLRALELPHTVLGAPAGATSTAVDTRAAAGALLQAGVDLILFAGGDGTARDVLDAVGERVPVLGVPAGVKMHSGVFAVSPEAAGELLQRLVTGGFVALRTAEVRDIDEEAFRRDVVRSRFYGDVQVPAEGGFLQHTKVGGKEDPSLAAAEAAAWLAQTLQPDETCLIGPGSTTAALMAELGLPNTLLGVDVVRGGELVAADADEAELLEQLARSDGPARIIVTAIGGQGHIFGRGNQQFSPAVIRAVGPDNVTVVATRSKLSALAGRPLLVDTNDPDLDRALCGYRTVVTGYDDRMLYPVSTGYEREASPED